MLDFTSSLYLGFEHPWRALAAWSQLTLGKPAALEELPEIPRLEREIALLTGCERAVAGPSTLHLFWDLFGILAERDVRILLDGGSYPIARWGAERAAAAGVQLRVFRQHDVGALRTAMGGMAAGRTVIVTDGFSPGSGEPAPLAEYAEAARSGGGLLVVDDTQAFGIFGAPQGASSPYGRGGGGSLQRLGLRNPEVVVISSLAKAFGVPIAVLGGSVELVKDFRRNSRTRMHCSPPAAAVVAAACQALEENRRTGEGLRATLARRVARFRRGLKRFGVLASSSPFPVQPLRMREGFDGRAIYGRLLDRGIQAVLHGESRNDLHCSLVITARHRESDIDQALDALVDSLAGVETGEERGRKFIWRIQG